MLPFGDRRRSMALNGVPPPELIDAGVVSCDLLAFELRTKGVGEPLRSVTGDFGGTWGGISQSSSTMLSVSSLSKGLGVAPGLRMGDSGLPEMAGSSEVSGAVVY